MLDNVKLAIQNILPSYGSFTAFTMRFVSDARSILCMTQLDTVPRLSNADQRDLTIAVGELLMPAARTGKCASFVITQTPTTFDLVIN